MKNKLINWGAGIIVAAAILAYIYTSVESDSSDKKFRNIVQDQLELQNQKADSLMRRQKLYEEAIDRLRYSINENQMEVRTVEKEKTKIYNNYIENVVRYSGDPKLDTVFTKDSIDFYQRVQSGWMFKK